MDNFKNYVSNTFAGMCNNYIMHFENEKTITGKIYYKVNTYGEFDYKFFFSNTVDSTFDNGGISCANTQGGEYEIISAYAGDGGICPYDVDINDLKQVTFESKTIKKVFKDECYWSDMVNIVIPDNHYLVFMWTVKGKDIVYTPDKIVPSYVLTDDGFMESCEFPQPQLVGCNKSVEKRLAFIGDSITQGLGTRSDYYEFWVSQIGKKLDKKISIWNLGLGYGRGADCATNGAWLKKAKQYDCVSVCFGVNDILQGTTKEYLINNIDTIVKILKENGCEVWVFTIPPFDMENENEKIRTETNTYILNEISKKADFVFDISKSLSKEIPFDNMAKYGGHPDGNGCEKICESFFKEYNKRFYVK